MNTWWILVIIFLLLLTHIINFIPFNSTHESSIQTYYVHVSIDTRCLDLIPLIPLAKPCSSLQPQQKFLFWAISSLVDNLQKGPPTFPLALYARATPHIWVGNSISSHWIWAGCETSLDQRTQWKDIPGLLNLGFNFQIWESSHYGMRSPCHMQMLHRREPSCTSWWLKLSS